MAKKHVGPWPKLKRCSDCKSEKDREINFTINKGRLGDGRLAVCKACMVDRTTRYRKANPERHNSYQRKYAKAKSRLLKHLLVNAPGSVELSLILANVPKETELETIPFPGAQKLLSREFCD